MGWVFTNITEKKMAEEMAREKNLSIYIPEFEGKKLYPGGT